MEIHYHFGQGSKFYHFNQEGDYCAVKYDFSQPISVFAHSAMEQSSMFKKLKMLVKNSGVYLEKCLVNTGLVFENGLIPIVEPITLVITHSQPHDCLDRTTQEEHMNMFIETFQVLSRYPLKLKLRDDFAYGFPSINAFTFSSIEFEKLTYLKEWIELIRPTHFIISQASLKELSQYAHVVLVLEVKRLLGTVQDQKLEIFLDCIHFSPFVNLVSLSLDCGMIFLGDLDQLPKIKILKHGDMGTYPNQMIALHKHGIEELHVAFCRYNSVPNLDNFTLFVNGKPFNKSQTNLIGIL
jgi:hypothetical protein